MGELSKTKFQINTKNDDTDDAISCHRNAVKKEDQPLLKYYDCGQEGIIKVKCATCSLINTIALIEFSAIKL